MEGYSLGPAGYQILKVGKHSRSQLQPLGTLPLPTPSAVPKLVAPSPSPALPPPLTAMPLTPLPPGDALQVELQNLESFSLTPCAPTR